MNKSVLKWERAVPILPNHFIQSSKFAKKKQFIPSYMKMECHNMFLLMAHEYARIYHTEKKVYEETTYPPTEKETLRRNVVTRGLRAKKLALEKKETKEPPKLFKMKRFQNIAAKVDHRRPPPGPSSV